MTALDWIVIAIYLLLMLVGASCLGRRQSSRKDYYLAGNKLPSWTLATSILATQCSTNSLLGAPAFVGFVIGGGMIWLQYELAVPLAMLVLCLLFLPIKRSGVISIYGFLENRLGRESRLLASGCFLVFRGVATGVTLYGVASIVELITGLPFLYSALLLMGVTIAYDVLGGMRAVVLSDVIQMLLLLSAVVIALIWLMGPLTTQYAELGERTDALVNDWGLTGNNYGFWPMLFGGLFLYTAYYGCDQSQAQRLLSAANDRETQKVLMLNGLLRFPLVLAYCLLGLGLAAYALEQADFVSSLPKTASGNPNFNLVFPSYVLREFAPGMAGLVIVGLFAAAMSSIDSALNSLSAATLEDFGSRLRAKSERQFFFYSKLLTFAWGIFALVFSFQVERIAPTVLEAINKIGSLANGPLLALFCIAVFSPCLGQRAAISGFIAGLLGTGLLSQIAPDLSWLWWNPIGFCLSWFVALITARISRIDIKFEYPDAQVPKHIKSILIGMALLILTLITCSSLLTEAKTMSTSTDRQASIQDAYNFKQLDAETSSSGAVTNEQVQSLAASGYQAVINLLPEENDHALNGEKQLIEAQGLDYIHIPVDFNAPRDADYEAFSRAMDKLGGQKLHVHCAANWRVSAFYAIYQVRKNTWSVDQAREHISAIWSPEEYPAWKDFLDSYLG